MTESDIVLKESGGSFPRPGFHVIGVGQTMAVGVIVAIGSSFLMGA